MTNQLPELTEGLVHVVWMEDEQVHTDEHPFCGDSTCLCGEDSALVQEHITAPLHDGLLTNAEAMRLYFGRTV
jgi:hypothetical protein